MDGDVIGVNYRDIDAQQQSLLPIHRVWQYITYYVAAIFSVIKYLSMWIYTGLRIPRILNTASGGMGRSQLISM